MNDERNNANELLGTGYLIVRVATAQGAIPLEGAQVNIREYSSESEGGGEQIAALVSGSDGNTEILALPTKPRADSLVSGDPKPYATYLAEVRLEGYAEETFIGIPIFDGIIAVQPVNLIPLPESGDATPQSPENNRFFETQGNSL